MYSDKQIEDVLFKAESSDKLFSYKIEGFSIYAVLRFSIETYIRNLKLPADIAKIQQPEVIQNFEKHSLAKRIVNKVKSIGTSRARDRFNSEVFDGIGKLKQSNVLFVATSDLVNKDGFSVELLDELRYYKEKGNVVNFVTPIYNTLPKKNPLYDYYGAIIKNDRKILSPENREELRKFLDYLSDILAIDFREQLNKWSYTISFFFNYCEELSLHIQKSNCRYVMCRSVYTEPWVTMACLRLNVKLIEVQHGVVKPDHIYYNSIKKENAKSLLMPDYILTLGEEWKDILIKQKFIYNDTNIFVLGTKEFTEVYDKDSIKPDIETVKVVIAMPPTKYPLLEINDYLTRFFEKYSKKLGNIQIVLRPHPIDGIKSLEVYNKYLSEKIVISNPSKENFKDLILGCDVLISVISMCLYEALSYGKTVISFGKFREQTIEKGITYINEVDELFEKLNNASVNNSYTVKYLSPLNLSVLDKFYN